MCRYSKRKQRTLIYDNLEIGREIKIGTIKYMSISHHQNAVQNLDIKVDCKCLTVEILAKTVANQNMIKENKRRFNSVMLAAI
jgi:hypothetical protein